MAVTYTLSPTSKPGFPVIERADGLSAVFSHWLGTDGLNLTCRVPTEFGTGWRLCGRTADSNPEAILKGLADGSINVPNEAWA